MRDGRGAAFRGVFAVKVLVIGDGLALTTGFARVIREACKGFVAAGFEVHQIAALDTAPTCDSRPYYDAGVTPWFPHGSDVIGGTVLRTVVEKVEPDVVFINCDPGEATNWHSRLSIVDCAAPTVVYAPVEGAPIAPGLAGAFKLATQPYTYTAWSSKVLRDGFGWDVPYVYHGVDRAEFHPLDEGERRRVRRELGWADKFVVSYVARNNGRKGHDRLLKAIQLLKGQGVDDVRLYLHCKPFDMHQLGGWDLQWLAEKMDIADMVEFSGMTRADKGEAGASLAAKLAASDLYCSASEVEGFGLPLIEAMAAGVPILAPNDKGNQAEIVGGAALGMLPVADWGTWHNGAQLARVPPEAIAQYIVLARGEPKARKIAAERGLARAALFDWQPLRDALTTAVQRAYEHESAVLA
jgi:glycosyltransferase involved in cell wall biosynthesis